MKKIIVLMLLMCSCAFAQLQFVQTHPPAKEHKIAEPYRDSYLAAHKIHVTNPFTDQGEGCSATAIGPHALLTAAHCNVPQKSITVDDQPATIELEMGDSADHSILFVSGVEFKAFATVEVREPEIGEDVFFWGNPLAYSDSLRKGHIAGWSALGGLDEMMVNINGAPGDSGSGLFDHNGILIGVLTDCEVKVENLFKLVGYLPLRFSPELLKKAREF